MIVLESDREWDIFFYWLYAFQTANHHGFRERDITIHLHPPIHSSIYFHISGS